MVEAFRDILLELVRAKARFLIVGAHALGVHGVPRASVDLDIWIDPAPDNAKRVWAALAAFGAPLETLEIHAADLTRPDTVAQFGLPPYRIDILTGVSGVSFEEAWNERVEDLFEDVRVPFLGRAALIRNKREREKEGSRRPRIPRRTLAPPARGGRHLLAGLAPAARHRPGRARARSDSDRTGRSRAEPEDR